MLHLNLWGGGFRLSVRNLIVDASSCSSQKYYCGTCTAVKDQSTSPSAAVQLYLLTADWLRLSPDQLLQCGSSRGRLTLCVSAAVHVQTSACSNSSSCFSDWLLEVSTFYFLFLSQQSDSMCQHVHTQIHRNTHSHALIQVSNLFLIFILIFVDTDFVVFS